MRRTNLLAAAGALALLTAAGQAAAQSAESIRVGAQVRGSLSEGDAAAADDAYRYDDYRFSARAGQRLEAILRADDFDAHAENPARCPTGPPPAPEPAAPGPGPGPPPPPGPPGMPPPAGGAGLGASVSGTSVVRIMAAIDAAFCSAARVTLAGSMTPAFTRSSYSPVAALKPVEPSSRSAGRTMTAPSWPALLIPRRPAGVRAAFFGPRACPAPTRCSRDSARWSRPR